MTTTKIKFLLLCLANLGLLFKLYAGDTVFTDLMKYRLKGKVKSVLETRYAVADKSDKASENKLVFQKK
jgi:hypothetical protein